MTVSRSTPEWAAVIPLPSTTNAPALAREILAQHAVDLAPGLLADALIIVSELVTNAVLHGEPEIALRVGASTSRIAVGVQDGNSAAPRLTGDSDPTRAGGRGLRIVDALSTSWGVTSAPPGKIVWFELGAPVGG